MRTVTFVIEAKVVDVRPADEYNIEITSLEDCYWDAYGVKIVEIKPGDDD